MHHLIPYLVAISWLPPCTPHYILCITTYLILLLLVDCLHAHHIIYIHHHIPYLVAISWLPPCTPHYILCITTYLILLLLVDCLHAHHIIYYASPHTLSCCYYLTASMHTTLYTMHHHIPYLVAISWLPPCTPHYILCISTYLILLLLVDCPHTHHIIYYASPHTLSCCY